MHSLIKELNKINSVIKFLDHQVSSLEHPICRTVLGTGYTVINKADALSALLEFAVQEEALTITRNRDQLFYISLPSKGPRTRTIQCSISFAPMQIIAECLKIT